jgi:hypothetical protein
MSRTLILHPALNPSSFVLLFVKGESGRSWSIRDYSAPNNVSVRYAREFSISLHELRAQATQLGSAPSTSTSDLDFWHKLTVATNERFNLPSSSAPSATTDTPGKFFPILHAERLMAMPKSRKAHDMKRILTSPNSEDWVTWNAFTIAQDLAPHLWWQHLVSLAVHDQAAAATIVDTDSVPKVTLWRSLPAPKVYEAQQRARMRVSTLPATMARSFGESAVEGESEIDIIIEVSNATVFIEAKLGSDISARTTHDSSRNQIIRNIDCLLDVAGTTTPYFWMLVRDRGEMRAYQQLLSTYRADPSALHQALPHRDPIALTKIAQRLSSILWKDFLTIIPQHSKTSSHGLVYRELLLRVG